MATAPTIYWKYKVKKQPSYILQSFHPIVKIPLLTLRFSLATLLFSLPMVCLFALSSEPGGLAALGGKRPRGTLRA